MISFKNALNMIEHQLNDDYKHYKNTKVFVNKTIDYDFGWYFGFDLEGEPLYGGPDNGVFVSKDGYQYKLHYVGFSWDTGFFQNIEENGIPTKYVVRYFLKQCKMKNVKHPSFQTDNGYDYENAIKWFKTECCVPHEEALNLMNVSPFKWQVIMVGEKNLQDSWIELKNEGLLDQNWENYYG